MKVFVRSAAAAIALSSLAAGSALAGAPATGLPPVQKSGQIEYLTGGIGKDQSMAFQRERRHWPLTLEFAEKDRHRDAFVADVAVDVRDAKGHTMLKTTAGGPFLLAKLPPGKYEVDATLAGKTMHEKALVKSGHPAEAVFVWPAGTDKHRS